MAGHVALDILGGIGGALVGVITGGLGGMVLGAIAGVTEVEALQTAKDLKTQTVANVGNFGTPTGTPTPTQPTTTTPTTPTTPTTTAISPFATDQAAIAREKAAEAELQINQSQEQLGQVILSQKTAEVQAEGGIRANVAARGLKMEGSPLMGLLLQEQFGAQTTAYTERQGAAAIAGMGIARQSAYDTAALSGKEQIQYADQQLSNAWLSAFTNIINFGTSALNRWTPDLTPHGGWTPDPSRDYSYDTSRYG